MSATYPVAGSPFSTSWFCSPLVLCAYLCSLKESWASLQHCSRTTGSFFLTTEYLFVQNETCPAMCDEEKAFFQSSPVARPLLLKPTFKSLAWIAPGVCGKCPLTGAWPSGVTDKPIFQRSSKLVFIQMWKRDFLICSNTKATKLFFQQTVEYKQQGVAAKLLLK